jgi:acetyl-CoA acetyltransferase
MAHRFKARTDVAVVGYAHSTLQRHASVSLGALPVWTALAAIADAGLTKDQIDGFPTGALLPSMGGHEPVDGKTFVSSNWLAERLGVNPRFASGFQGYGQLSGSVMLAVNAIASGACDYVLMHRALYNPPGTYHENPMTEVSGNAQWIAPQGFWGPMAMIALPYNEYLQRYNAERSSLATVVVEARKNGSRIPTSYWYGKPITADDYMDARIVADPICLLDCDIPVDGVASFILTSAERAADLPHKPVYVAGYTQGHQTTQRAMLHWPLDDIMETGIEAGRRLWEHTGLTAADIDVPQLYDGFSPFIYFWLESLGYCARGEAHQFVQEGRIDSDTGGLPILSGGGAGGNGRMHGVPQMLECYLQLSQRAGARQLAKADIGLACHSSPHFGGAVMYSSHRL